MTTEELIHTIPEPVKAQKAKSVFFNLKSRLQEKGLWRGETALVGGAIFFAIFGAILQKSNQTSFETRIKEQYSIAVPVLPDRFYFNVDRTDAGNCKNNFTIGQLR